MRSEKQHCDIVHKGDSTKLEFFYHGFWPDADLRKRLSAAIYRVLDLTPAKTSLHSRIERCENGFKMFVMLAFEEGSIFAVHRGPNPKKAIQRTLDKVHFKLKAWRREKLSHGGELVERLSKKWRETEERACSTLEFAPKVLIVDDNPFSIKLIQSCLRQQGCKTNVVTKGSEAVREITRNAYDLVVLDWRMPELNGAETLVCAQDIISYDSTFRSPWVTNQIPVITYSGEDRDQMNFPKCENFELMGHISKSSTFAQLKHATFTYLRALRPV